MRNLTKILMKAFNELAPYQDDPIVRQIIWEILPAASKIERISVDEFIDQNLTSQSTQPKGARPD